ncbi:Hypothetical protein I596_3530 [Dokdonella koreensis DS-123]|uniref:Uncharacterized protein n=1 Tax=Dokdonella koreensis DS-123 TaxID=1300342 RepID=A0A160DXQ6_9GAMM|nr:Hypothetical protein I596_3530 [Dokdonella koreensis DS-123]
MDAVPSIRDWLWRGRSGTRGRPCRHGAVAPVVAAVMPPPADPRRRHVEFPITA